MQVTTKCGFTSVLSVLCATSTSPDRQRVPSWHEDRAMESEADRYVHLGCATSCQGYLIASGKLFTVKIVARPTVRQSDRINRMVLPLRIYEPNYSGQ